MSKLQPRRTHLVALAAAAALLPSVSAHAAPATWTSPADGNWADGPNWSTAAAPGQAGTTINTDTATFNSAGVKVTVDASRNIQNITFDGNVGAFAFNGGGLSLTTGGQIQMASTITSGASTAVAVTINTPITVLGDYSFISNCTTKDTLTLGTVTSSATSGTTTLTLGGAGTPPTYAGFVGVISDGGGTNKMAVKKTGVAGWALTGTQNYSGGTTVEGGTLYVGTNSANGTLGSGDVSISSGANLNIVGVTAQTLPNKITGAGKITKGGGSSATLTAQNTFTGGITLGANTIIGSDSASYSGDANLTYNGGLGQPAATTTAVTFGDGATLGLRANGQDDAAIQTLTYFSNYLATQQSLSLTKSGGGGNYTISVDRQGGAGQNKVLAIGGRTALVRNGTLSVTGGNGYSVKLAALQLNSGNADGQTWTLNPTTAALVVGPVVVPAYNSILVLDGTNTANSVGAIPDSSTTKLMSVTKQNSSTWTLSGNNSYTGATNVTAGTLLVNGSLAAGSVVTVNGSAAVLGGTGTINGPVTITSGTLAPGTSAGTLNIKNTLALGGTSAFELGALASDKVIGVTNITFGGALNVTNIDATLAEGATFDLFDWTGNRNGQFATITLPTLPASYDWKYFTAPDNTQQQFDYATGQIQVVAVPEPGIVALAGVVGMAALARRHRKN